MPNGNHYFNEETLPKLEKFFGQFSEGLENFAEKHNLLIDKYWHQFHSWRFSFKHPKGGIATLELFRETESMVQVCSYWWIDDYARLTRFSRKSRTDFFESQRDKILQILEDKFSEILTWNLNYWTDITKEFENVWSKYSMEAFYKLNEKYPVPKL